MQNFIIRQGLWGWVVSVLIALVFCPADSLAKSCAEQNVQPPALNEYPDRFTLKADAKAGFQFDVKGKAYPKIGYMLPPLAVGYVDGRAEVVDAIKKFTLYNSDNSPLSWPDAKVVLASNLPFQMQLSRTFADSEVDEDVLPDGSLLRMPKVLKAFAPSLLTENEAVRELIYKSAFLRVVSDKDLADALKIQVSDYLIKANQSFLQTAASGVNYLNNLKLLDRVGQGANAAMAHGQATDEIYEKVAKRMGRTGSGKALKWAKGIAVFANSVQAFADGKSRASALAEAYRNVETFKLLEDLGQILIAAQVDPAMLKGWLGAVEAMADYSDSYFQQILAGAKQTGVPLSQFGLALLAARITNPASLIVSELSSLGFDIGELGVSAGRLAALENIDVVLRTSLLELISAGRSQGLDSTALNLRELLGFQQRLNFLLADELYGTLWEKRFSLSASGVAKWVTFGVKDLFNPGLQAAKLSLREQHLQTIRMEMAVRDHLADLVDALQPSYAGPAATGTAQSSIITLIDNSGSNSHTDPTNLRAAAMRLILDTAEVDTRLGVVLFDDTAAVVADAGILGPLDGGQRDLLRNKLQLIGAGGGTNIRAGLTKAAELVCGENASIILLSDGQDHRWRGEVDMLAAGIKIHTIALSAEADQEGLSQASAMTGGIAAVARDATDLHNIIDSLFGTAEGRQMLASRNGVMKTGDRVEFSFFVEPDLGGLDCQVTLPGSDIDLTVISPDGKRIPINEAVRDGFGVEALTYDIIRLQNPQAGQWSMQLEGVALAAQGEAYTARAYARQPRIQTRWIDSVVVPEAGSSFYVSVDTQGEVTWNKVNAVIYKPDGSVHNESRTLDALAAALGGEENIGVFDFLPKVPGVYQILVELKGETRSGAQVARMMDRTFRVAPAGIGKRYEHQIDPFIRRVPGAL